MKNRELLKEIPVHPYPVDLWVLIADDVRKAVTKLCLKNKGLEIKWSEDMAAWTEDVFYNGYVLTIIFDPKEFDVNTVAHECIHIKNRIFEHTDILHDFKNDEPEAYLVGWLVGELQKAYNEFKKL